MPSPPPGGCISNIILQDRSCQWSQVRFIPFWSVPAFSIKCCSMDKRMLSLLLLIGRIGISWTSFKACLGWLKWMGTDSSVLFWIPRLCSPKRSLNVRLVWPIYWHGSVGSCFVQRLQLIKYMRLSEEQDRFCGILRCSPVLWKV